MRFLLFLFTVLICGCSTIDYDICVPDRKLDNYSIAYCGDEPSDMGFGRYVAVLEREWNRSSLFPHDPRLMTQAFNSIVIFWQPRIFRHPGVDGDLLGLTYMPIAGRIHMFVYVPPNCKDAGCTALGHELIHVAYGAISDDMYPNHLTDSIDWPDNHKAFLEEVRKSYLEQK